MPVGGHEAMSIAACAKINLTLEVLGRRSDGYHEIRTVFQTIDLKDMLYFQRAPSLELKCTYPELEGENNLAFKAACALQRASGCREGATIRLEKGIPVGMGLGGGSSDAAATLLALNALWGLDLGPEGLLPIAADLGSDVPFFLRGGTALGQGRGDVISSLPSLPDRWLVLLCSSKRLPEKTARLYSMLTGDHFTDGTVTNQAVERIKNGDLDDGIWYNVFESLASKSYRDFQRLREGFVKAGADRVHLAGSGPALFSFVKDKAAGEALRGALQEKGLMAYLVSTV